MSAVVMTGKDMTAAETVADPTAAIMVVRVMTETTGPKRITAGVTAAEIVRSPLQTPHSARLTA